MSSCGSLRITPQDCHTSGVWGDKIVNEVKISDNFFVWNNDLEIQLKDLLKLKDIDCTNVKKLRLEVKSFFLINKEVSIYVQL